MNKYDLSRFIKAHEHSYESALNEIRDGKKRSHWMWYIFPQIKGLGMSETSIYYSISGINEAKAYINDPVLGKHLIEICEVLCRLETNDASKVFGFPDDMKLKSSMTLFREADPDNHIYERVLDKFFHGECDKKTLSILKESVKQ